MTEECCSLAEEYVRGDTQQCERAPVTSVTRPVAGLGQHRGSHDPHTPRRCGGGPSQGGPPSAREAHRPAVKRSAARATRAARLLSDRGHQLTPALRARGHDLLNEHEFRVRVALESAEPGLSLAAVEKRESGYLKAFQQFGGERAAAKAKTLPKDEERTTLRATREVLLEATGVDAAGEIWGAPFRALEELFGAGHAPMEALSVSAKFFADGTALTQRYHVALQPPCDCWTFGREAVVEQARRVAKSLKAPPLVDAWLDAIAVDDEGKLPSLGFGVNVDDGAGKLSFTS